MTTMTTKTSDKEVLATIGDMPISAAEIARKVGIHRSNVAPRLKRLEKARRIKSIYGRWVRTDSNKSATITGTRLTPTQIEFCEKLMYGEDESYEVGEMADDAGKIYYLLANLRNLFPENNFLRHVAELALVNFVPVSIDVDEPLESIREEITGEKSLTESDLEHLRDAIGDYFNKNKTSDPQLNAIIEAGYKDEMLHGVYDTINYYFVQKKVHPTSEHTKYLFNLVITTVNSTPDECIPNLATCQNKIYDIFNVHSGQYLQNRFIDGYIQMKEDYGSERPNLDRKTTIPETNKPKAKDG
jgi:DNA-binding Lrp family transcriptional regulator